MEREKIEAFTERVLGLQEFKAFTFLKSGLSWVYVGHGLGKFFLMFGTVLEHNGKALMFVGDWGGGGTQLQSCHLCKTRGSGFQSRC